ncbi:hypothetical protein ODZ84_17945 [Chryseobacterium fluminis]|uniref:hypothetical protein n=1 Tax=Chryseobacterium fluminis TaxID=2983606 RepID=UPI00225137B9|nr:hypothetical protein [Chryseobacterium sp. MMS21-Ot14]UZT97066.1 hypothetical protein ODZ84_17945 [Chryseobacterium sp. MMS21-Ot14]
MEIKKTTEIKKIWYKGKMKDFPISEIPLSKLIYNKYNGRIKSLVLSYESGIGRILNATDTKDKGIIESYLYDSAANRNEKTLQSLQDYGQQEIGIVTSDMIIIDGNRRASLLNKLHREDKIETNVFKAIILDEKLEDNPLEIIKLETNYQMGVDNKVEYKPIEKYLRCHELIHEHQVDINEVAKLMSESVHRINQWLDILSLMNEYLIYLDSPKVYTRLDKKEGHFVDLYNYIKKYKASNINVIELKEVYFDYIRLGVPVQRVRIIGNPNNSQSLFAKQDLWIPFYENHKMIKASYNETSFSSVKPIYPDKSNEEIFDKLDNDFQDKIGLPLKENLTEGEIQLKILADRNATLKELNRILNYIVKLKIVETPEEEVEQISKLLENISQNAILKRAEL